MPCRVIIASIIVFGLVSLTTATAEPIVCDLRTEGSCAIGSAIFSTVELQPTGTGVIDAFLRVQNKGTEQGYNTSYRDLQFDEKTDPNFTRDLLLTEVGTTSIDGVLYATFYLDINEPGASGKDFLTLDQLEIFTSDLAMRTNYSGVVNTETGALPGTIKIFDLDANGDSYIQLSYNLFGGGSGQSDMAFYLPISLFSGEYVNLFSQFGTVDGSQSKSASEAGFEEWFTRAADEGGGSGVAEIPEPGTLGLMGVGLLMLRRRYQSKR
jgi:hypothetical protein